MGAYDFRHRAEPGRARRGASGQIAHFRRQKSVPLRHAELFAILAQNSPHVTLENNTAVAHKN